MLIAALALATPAGAHSEKQAFSSFYVPVSAYPLSSIGQISVNGYASFRDYDCTPSYACDRNVFASFTVHRGLSRYSPRVASWTDETGQYGTSLRQTLRVPRCSLIPRYRTITYTIYMRAVAPNGEERSAQTYVYLRSCA